MRSFQTETVKGTVSHANLVVTLVQGFEPRSAHNVCTWCPRTYERESRGRFKPLQFARPVEQQHECSTCLTVHLQHGTVVLQHQRLPAKCCGYCNDHTWLLK